MQTGMSFKMHENQHVLLSDIVSTRYYVINI